MQKQLLCYFKQLEYQNYNFIKQCQKLTVQTIVQYLLQYGKRKNGKRYSGCLLKKNVTLNVTMFAKSVVMFIHSHSLTLSMMPKSCMYYIMHKGVV